MRALAMPLALSLMIAPALAASSQVEAAIKAFQDVVRSEDGKALSAALDRVADRCPD